MSPNQDWRVTLQEWLKENPKTMPDELNELHQSFLEEFPIEKVSNFAYEDFVSGYEYWYWLTERTSLLAKRVSLLEEYKESNNFTNQWVGIIKNVLQNIKLWTRTHSSTVSEKIDRISKEVEEEFGKKNNRLIIRLLYLHFPSDFLPIVNQKHIIHILNYFKQSYQGNICEDNHRLTQFLLQQPEFNCLLDLKS